MKLAIMQPYLFPYLGYFQLIHASDRFVFYDDVNYIKSGWINRNRILLDGAAHYFTVPLSQASSFATIRDTRVSANTTWRRKMLETVRIAYKGAPFRDLGMELLEGTLALATDSVADLARHSVKSAMKHLSLRRDIVESSAVYGNASLKGQERVLDICKRESADTYVNMPGGRHLYDGATFHAASIELRFLSGRLPQYPQPVETFVPGLSILDVIMRCPADDVAAMVTSYELRDADAFADPPSSP